MSITKGTYRKTIWDKLKRQKDVFFRMIDYIPTRVHLGKYYSLSHKFTAISSDNTESILIKVGSEPIHITFSIVTNGDADGAFYEGTEVSDNGTEANLINHKRTGTVRATDTKVFYSPSVSSKGTNLIDNEYMPGGNWTFNFFGGASSKREEWVLAANTNYLVEVHNDSASEIKACVSAGFFENSDLLS